MSKKILTVEDLEYFFQKHKLSCFSSQDSGYQICVHIPIEFSDVQIETSDHILYAWTKLFHVGVNRNKSYISIETAKEAMCNLAYKPILANFIDNEDGERDFSSHDMEFNEDGDITYIEQPVGCFTNDPAYLEMDEDEGHEFVFARIAIPKNYTEAAEILLRKGGTKISMEAVVDKMAFNKKEKVLEFKKFEITGATLLGEHISEGMKGAKVSLEDFRLEKNSIVNQAEKLNQFNAEELFKEIGEDKKGGTGEMKDNHKKEQFEDSEVEQDEVKEEDTAPVEESFDSEKENFAEDEEKAEPDEDSEPEAPAPEEDDSSEEDDGQSESDSSKKPTDKVNGQKKLKHMAVDENGTQVVTWELSFTDTTRRVMEAIDKEYGRNLEVVESFNGHLIVRDWYAQKLFAQKYHQSDEGISLDGDLVQVFIQYMTKDALEEVQMMKDSISVLREELNVYRTNESNQLKDKVLAEAAYAPYLEEEEFVELINSRDSYSAEEFADKAELAFARAVKRMGLIKRKKKCSEAFNFSNPGKELSENKQKYGNLFAK